ncbi:MAG: PAS domain-containing protein [Coxiellaceae bacterium]|nr:PAS domain-containing protein [Coxiellaceae bacterium]
MKFTHDFDHMPGALYCKDLEGRYIWANQGLLEILHFEMDDVIGKDDWEVIKEPEDVEHIKAMDKQVIDREELLTCIETVHTDGKEKQFLTYKSPLRDEHGEIIGIQGCTLPLEDEHFTDLRNFL